MKFKDVVGQETIKKQLIQTVSTNRISHAQLFVGPTGSGKLATALAYAQYINCKNPTQNDSCGECSSCIKYEKLAHPDLHFIFPVNKTKDITDTKIYSSLFYEQWRSFLQETGYYPTLNDWYDYIKIEKKQGFINAEEADNINNTLAYKAYEAKYKVLIIWMADKMNITAANKLLKNLEEPPKNTLFILITEDKNSLLETILSRTQTVQFNKIDDNSITNAIKPLVDDIQRCEQISLLSNGNFSEAYKLAMLYKNDETNVLSENFIVFRDWMREIYRVGKNFSYYEQLQGIIEIIVADGNREKIKTFFTYCLHIMHICLNYNVGNTKIEHFEGEETEFISAFSKFIHKNNIHLFETEINKAILHIERNANPLIVITDLSLSFSQIIHITDK